MPTTLKMQGLDELRRQLRSLPEDMTQEANVIVRAHADDAARAIVSGYAEGPTGNLRRGVVTERGAGTGRLGASAIVRSRAKHAWLFENGSGQRRTSTGANRGRMPAAPESQRFIPKAIRVRRRMVEALKDLLRRAGFEVQG